MVFNLAFFGEAHQRQIKDRIKICLHEDGVVLTAPDAKINTGKILFWKKNANLSTRQNNQLYSIGNQFYNQTNSMKKVVFLHSREYFREYRVIEVNWAVDV